MASAFGKFRTSAKILVVATSLLVGVSFAQETSEASYQDIFAKLNSKMCSQDKKNKRGDVALEIVSKELGGKSISITGRCNKNDLKDGQFNYQFDDVLIMKTKYIDDIEQKTDCVSFQKNRRISQKRCLERFFNDTTR